MMRDGVVPDAFLLPKIVQACSNVGKTETGKLLHSIAVKCGHLKSSATNHANNSILSLYAKGGELSAAVRFFEKLSSKDQVSWNSIIFGHCQCGKNEKAMELFKRMQMEGIEPSLVTWNILIRSYNQSGRPDLAMELMEKMNNSGVTPNVFTWTIMISGFAQNNKTSQCMELFVKMLLSEVKPNCMTVANVISALADLKDVENGRELHSYAVKIGGSDNLLVGNSLVDMYSKSGRLDDARRIFNEILEKDVFTWNSMIGGYTKAGYCGKAYDLFSKMESLGVHRDVITWNVMITGYIQEGDDDLAMDLFQKMEKEGIKRNTASWNTLIAGSVRNGCTDNAFRIFRQMQFNYIRPNLVTILSILPACSNLVSAMKVKEIHASILHSGVQYDTSITNSLINTYSNSGNLQHAQTLFRTLLLKDLISWNSMISGCVLHGCSHLARDLYSQMEQEGIKPNQAIFASVISAYSLDGMVKKGKQFFHSMLEVHELSPGLKHYAAMVDLFGRSGWLREALDLIENMPIEPNSAVWNALLTASRNHGNVKIAILAAENLIRLDPDSTRSRSLTESINAMSARSNYVSNARKPKRERSVGDPHDCSWVEIRNKVHTFFNGDQPSIDLQSKLADYGFVTGKTKIDTKLDIEEDRKEIGEIHSEESAMAFGLINSSSFKSIRIVKSVKMCSDCHTIAKLVSRVYHRTIILKDPMCLHCFKDGRCSCRDYW